MLVPSDLVFPIDAAASEYRRDDRLTANGAARTTYDGKPVGVARCSEAVGLFSNAGLSQRPVIPAPSGYASLEHAAEALPAAGLTPVTFGNSGPRPPTVNPRSQRHVLRTDI